MNTFTKSFAHYKKLMREGEIQRAYQGLMKYFMTLRTNLQKAHPQFEVSGIQYGYMDQTYFLFYPQSLKKLGLKVAIVFVHETCRFDIWLASRNGKFRKKYWQRFKDANYEKYSVVASNKAVDPILEHTLAADPDFRDLDELMTQIERGAMSFIREVGNFLAKS